MDGENGASKASAGDGSSNIEDPAEMSVDAFCSHIAKNIQDRKKKVDDLERSAEENPKLVANRALSSEMAAVKGMDKHIARTNIERKLRVDGKEPYKPDQFWV